MAETKEGVGTPQKELRSLVLVDLKDLDPKSISDEDRKSYVSLIHAAQPALKWMLNEIISAQILKWSRDTWNNEQFAFHNGGMNMADLILEYVESLSAEHIENSKPQPKLDPTAPPLTSGSDLEGMSYQ